MEENLNEINANIKLFYRTLQLKPFLGLMPDYQIATLEEVEKLVFSKHLPYPDKRRFLGFLSAIAISESASVEVKNRIEHIVMRWEDPPL